VIKSTNAAGIAKNSAAFKLHCRGGKSRRSRIYYLNNFTTMAAICQEVHIIMYDFNCGLPKIQLW
jgi:hypothetical protein